MNTDKSIALGTVYLVILALGLVSGFSMATANRDQSHPCSGIILQNNGEVKTLHLQDQ